MNGKVSKVIDIYEHYSSLFEQLENNAGQAILNIVGSPDNVAGLFKFSDYNLTSWITDYLDETSGSYYTCLLYTSPSPRD